MSAPSPILSDSSSRTSTPSSEFVPSRLYLLSPHIIRLGRLGLFASRLDKGYGDRILLSVAHTAPFEVNSIKAAIMHLSELVTPDACLADKEWVKVSEGNHILFYCFHVRPDRCLPPRRRILPRRRRYSTRRGVIVGCICQGTQHKCWFGECFGGPA